MLQIQVFTNNPYQENTYLVFDESKACAIIDPGMYTLEEKDQVVQFIQQQQLRPVLLLNTHCHIDHVFGNQFVFDQYGLKPQFHEAELAILTAMGTYAQTMNWDYEPSPLPDLFLPETGPIALGNTQLIGIFAPGHSPAHMCFYAENENFLIGGDVLFYENIGRTDLPGGNFDRLITSIKENIFSLPDDCTVYPGHGPKTYIRHEKQYNPFLAGYVYCVGWLSGSLLLPLF